MNASLFSQPLGRLLATCALMGLVFSCQSNGCAGCETQEIPGGYPTGERIEGAMDSSRPEDLAAATATVTSLLQRLVDIASAIIHGSTPQLEQDEIDDLLDG